MPRVHIIISRLIVPLVPSLGDKRLIVNKSASNASEENLPVKQSTLLVCFREPEYLSPLKVSSEHTLAFAQ